MTFQCLPLSNRELLPNPPYPISFTGNNVSLPGIGAVEGEACCVSQPLQWDILWQGHREGQAVSRLDKEVRFMMARSHFACPVSLMFQFSQGNHALAVSQL